MNKPHAPASILIVEDEAAIAWLYEELLAELGFRDIRAALDLATARQLLDERAPDLAILDVNIGAHPVFPLAQELRARHVPILFSTGASGRDFPDEWLRHPVLLKPVTRCALTAMLDSLGFRPGARLAGAGEAAKGHDRLI